MNIGNYIMAPSVRQVAPPPPPPSAQVVANSALLVAQNAASQTRTQTTVGLQALGGAEQTRTGQSRKETGETVDSNANAVTTRSRGGGGAPRGQRLDVRV